MSAFTLPVISGAGCTLDADGFAKQRGRVLALREHVERVETSDGKLRIAFDASVDRDLVYEFLVTEGACCNFLSLGWDESGRALTIGADDQAKYDVVGGFAAVFSGGAA